MKRKCNAYLLWPFGKKLIFAIVRSTVCDYMVFKNKRSLFEKFKNTNILFRSNYQFLESTEDRRILVGNAKKIESDLYQMANSRPEYYHLIVAKIYEIHTKLDEMKKKRRRSVRQLYYSSLSDLGGSSDSAPISIPPRS